MEKKITVKLTAEEWHALLGAAVGELESLTERDLAEPMWDSLRSAVEALKDARIGTRA